MNSRTPEPLADLFHWKTWRNTIATLLIGGLAGSIGVVTGIPLPWLTAPMAAIAAAALCGPQSMRPLIGVHPKLVPLVFILLGVTAGAAVTPEVVSSIHRWPVSLLILLVTLPLIVLAGARVLQMAGWDRGSAILGSVPGALSVTMALAQERGSDVAAIATVQIIRLGVLVLILPLVVAPASGVANPPEVQPASLIILLLACAATAALAIRLRIPGGWLIGSMAMSAFLHGSGWNSAIMPSYVANGCLVALAAMIGGRFTAFTRAQFVSAALLGLALVAVTGLVAVFGAFLTSAVSGLPVLPTVLAFAPGGLEAMIIMAALMDADPAYVAAHQVVRFLAIGLLMPVYVRYYTDD